MTRFSEWPEPVEEELERLLDRGESWSGDERPLVTLDFDNTCIVGDTGEVVHYELCDQLAYAFDDERFWAAIDPEDGRDDLRARWEALSKLDDPRLSDDAALFSTDLIATYSRRYARLGAASAYEWAVRLHAGLSAEWLRRFSGHVFAEELNRPRRIEERRTSDGLRLLMDRGIRIRPAMRELVRHFEAAGFDVWIVSATNVWSVQAVAPHLGVSPSRVVGQSCRVDGDIISGERDGPTTWRQGKVDAIDQSIGRRPQLAIGDAFTDLEMLNASDMSILIDKGDAALRAHAEEAGWHIVPAASLSVKEPESF